MLKFVEGGRDMIGHGDVNVFVLVGIFPVDCQAQVFGACAIDCDCIELFMGMEEMVEVVRVGIFDPEVIDYECECG